MSIKANKNTPFCILTLTKMVPFAPNVEPLCLPEMINNKYDQIVHEAEVLGFGYNKDFENHLKTWPKKSNGQISVRKERPIESWQGQHTVRPSSQCALQFGTWALKDGHNIHGFTKYEWIEKYL